MRVTEYKPGSGVCGVVVCDDGTTHECWAGDCYPIGAEVERYRVEIEGRTSVKVRPVPATLRYRSTRDEPCVCGMVPGLQAGDYVPARPRGITYPAGSDIEEGDLVMMPVHDTGMTVRPYTLTEPAPPETAFVRIRHLVSAFLVNEQGWVLREHPTRDGAIAAWRDAILPPGAPR